MPKLTPIPGFITLRELIPLLNVSESTLFRWVRANRLPHVRLRVGEHYTRYIFSLEAIQKHIADNSFDGRGFASPPQESQKEESAPSTAKEEGLVL
jgi:excisionase family DNA binding protein